MSGARPLPVLMRPAEVLSLHRAAVHAKKSEVQIRRWCKRYGISRQQTQTSPHEISLVALEMVLHADWDALELLRTGDRSSPQVKRYLDFLGLPE
jgi:hypothetical protein